MPPRTFIDAIRETLADEMRRDESVIVLGEDVGKKGGVFLATDGLWAEFGEDRVIDTPLTESMIVGASIGAAVNGLRPVAEIQFADFIFPAFNQIVSEAARMRYRSNNGYGVPMTIRAPYGGGVHGALYHSQSVEAFFTHVPGLKVVVPSTPHDARGLLRSSIRDDDPVLFFEHKKMYRSVRGDVPDTDYTVPLGKAKITHPGSQVTVVAYGLMAHYALEAADRVADDGISVEVVDLRTLRPLDRETLLDSVRKTGKCLVVYEDNKFGGYGAEVAAIVAEEAFDYLDGPVTQDRRPRGPRACPTTTSSRTGSWSTPRRSPTASGRSRRTEAGEWRTAKSGGRRRSTRSSSGSARSSSPCVPGSWRLAIDRAISRSRSRASKVSRGAMSPGSGAASATSATT